jgi:hypothetical protein
MQSLIWYFGSSVLETKENKYKWFLLVLKTCLRKI